MYTAVIEIPKGVDRRIHKSITTGEFVDYGSIKEVIPINEGKMPVDYGFLKNTLNKDEGDEIDVLIFSNTEHSVGDEAIVTPIGLFIRDDLDHKVLAVEGEVPEKNFSEFPVGLQKLILNFFSYKHKITSVKGKAEAVVYIDQNKTPSF